MLSLGRLASLVLLIAGATGVCAWRYAMSRAPLAPPAAPRVDPMCSLVTLPAAAAECCRAKPEFDLPCRDELSSCEPGGEGQAAHAPAPRAGA